MALPASLLTAVEDHPCFPGAFSSESDIRVVYDPQHRPGGVIAVSCAHCFAKFGAFAATLPRGISSHQLADALTTHVGNKRGYLFNLAGYHVALSDWLSAACYPFGVLLVQAERAKRGVAEIDLLIDLLRAGKPAPPDPRMLDRNQYALRTVYMDKSAPPVAAKSLADLLASPLIHQAAGNGRTAVVWADFLPITTQHAAAVAAAAVAAAAPQPVAAKPKPPAKPLQPGDRCETCGEIVCERPLFTSSYMGCGC